MCPLTFTALLGIAAGCERPGPSDLLAPANPALVSHWRPPPSPTAGLKTYKPVDATAKGWLGGNAAAANRMPGMDMPGTKNMPFLEGMPGMSGDGK